MAKHTKQKPRKIINFGSLTSEDFGFLDIWPGRLQPIRSGDEVARYNKLSANPVYESTRTYIRTHAKLFKTWQAAQNNGTVSTVELTAIPSYDEVKSIVDEHSAKSPFIREMVAEYGTPTQQKSPETNPLNVGWNLYMVMCRSTSTFKNMKATTAEIAVAFKTYTEAVKLMSVLASSGSSEIKNLQFAMEQLEGDKEIVTDYLTLIADANEKARNEEPDNRPQQGLLFA